MDTGFIGSRKLSLVGSGILAVFCLVLGLVPYIVTGPTVTTETSSSPLQLITVFIVGWAAIYFADRINTNKKHLVQS